MSDCLCCWTQTSRVSKTKTVLQIGHTVDLQFVVVEIVIDALLVDIGDEAVDVVRKWFGYGYMHVNTLSCSYSVLACIKIIYRINDGFHHESNTTEKLQQITELIMV